MRKWIGTVKSTSLKVSLWFTRFVIELSLKADKGFRALLRCLFSLHNYKRFQTNATSVEEQPSVNSVAVDLSKKSEALISTGMHNYKYSKHLGKSPRVGTRSQLHTIHQLPEFCPRNIPGCSKRSANEKWKTECKHQCSPEQGSKQRAVRETTVFCQQPIP